MKNRIIASILVVAMVLYMLLTIIPPVLAVGNTINIDSKDDFVKFSEKCTLDTWSQGKTVNLNCDIDFSNSDFSPIPTFGGTFNGNGYTISGISFESKGSYQGVFRYVQQDGKISNLNVKGTFIPGGSKSFIGGIVGKNSGTLENCTFSGSVKGENVIGGIVGNNTDYGQIISCISYGNIIGENSTGGVAGKNSGFIRNCTNNATVNTVYEEKKSDITNIDTDAGAMIENYRMSEEESEEQSVLGHSDTGGIVGYSSGIVQGCINNAAIGYQHIGYNVGGIAGRQSGFMLGCKNHGFIQGRKDVGGIVGQAEPYILLNTSESTLQDLRSELNNLNSMVNKFITDTDNLGDDAEKHLSGISGHAKNALDSAENLLNQGTDFVDDNLSEINAQSAILSNTIDKLIPVFESLENSGTNLADTLDKTREALDNIKIYAPNLNYEIDDISSALSEISRAERSIKKAVQRANRASNDLDEAIEFNNTQKVKTSISELSAAIKDIITSKQAIKTSLGTIETILKTKPENFESIGINAKEIAENLKTFKENVDTTISSLKTIEQSIDTITLNNEIDFSKFKSAAQNMESAIGYIGDAMYYITDGLKDLGTAIEDLSEEIYDYADDVIDELNNAKNDLADAITSLSYTADDIKTAIGGFKDIIADLSNEKPLEFVKLGDDFKNTSENLFDAISGISSEIDGLKDTVSNGKSKITGDLTSISNQFNLVMNLLIGKFEELSNGNNGLKDVFLDVSDEDIENTKQGKIDNCQNFGTVEADRNTGGIVGAMAIEYSKDPEDDIEKPDTLNFTYRTKAILYACINDGKVTGKKDCTGGVVGLSEIGTVYGCENYGNIESTNGNYVGGIAGKSESAIRKSYAKSKLTGKRYIGGIAGKTDIITACYTIVNVSGEENTGAICGDTEGKEKLYQNFFVNSGLGGIDGISYTEKAEPISFEKLKNMNGIPLRFISFTVTFIADDKIIQTQEIKFGDETARIKYPEIPKKDGHFGNWQQIEAETITENIEIICEYQPYITVLSSVQKNENGKLALALAEGRFTDKAELNITDSNQKPPASADGNIKVYDISLSNTDIRGNDTVTLRILNENKDKVTAWILKGDKWEKVETTDKGKYVLLQANGTQNTICLKYVEKNFSFIWIGLIMVIVLFSAFLLFKQKYRKTKK